MGVQRDDEAVSIDDGPEMGAYDIWRARRDIDRLAFGLRSTLAEVPPELARLEQFLQRLPPTDR